MSNILTKTKKIVAIGGIEFEVERSVTRPVLKIEKEGAPEFVHVQGLIRQAPLNEGETAKKGPDGNPLPPPMLMDVADIRDGEEKVVVVNTLLQTNLEEVYPEGTYVGKFFQVTKYAPKGDKRYATFDIKEIKPKAKTPEAPAPDATQAATEPAKGAKKS